MIDPANPLIVQRDLTVLLDVASPRALEARAGLARFADLEKAPEHIHTYRITPRSLWNAAVAGVTTDEAIDVLVGLARYPVADSVIGEVAELMGRYGRLWLARDDDGLVGGRRCRPPTRRRISTGPVAARAARQWPGEPTHRTARRPPVRGGGRVRARTATIGAPRPPVTPLLAAPWSRLR